MGLDKTRGLAVILMVQQHLGTWLTDLREIPRPLMDLAVAVNELGGLAAPLFVLASGYAATLGRPTWKGALVRGLALFGFGLITNVLTPSWFGLTSFYVLHLLGCAAALTPLLLRLAPLARLWVGLALLAVSPFLQILAKVPRFSEPAMMRGDGTLLEALRLAVVAGHFPVVPWLGLFAIGSYLPAVSPRVQRQIALGSGVMATLLFAAAPVAQKLVGRALALRLSGIGFYPTTLPFLTLALAAGTFLLSRYVEKTASPEPTALARLGRISLSLFVGHVVLFRQWWPVLVPHEGKVSPLVSLLVLGGVLLTAVLVSKPWEKRGYRFSLEWLLRRLSRAVAPREIPSGSSSFGQRPVPK